METCTNCGATLKKGFTKTVETLSQEKIDFINSFQEEKKETYCSKCGSEPYDSAHQRLNREIMEIQSYLNQAVNKIPIASIHYPFEWEYKVIGIVTGQTVTGTGAISEFKSDITDFFGRQSKSFNKKIAKGEQMCFAQLRSQTIEQGGNAIIGVDIDYADVGSGKGMLMVCATGTAVKVKNIDVFEEHVQKEISDIADKLKRLNYLTSEFKNYIYQTGV